MSDDRLTVTGTLTFNIESKEQLRQYRELFEQRWPPEPRIVADTYREFGDERAEQLVRQARRRRETSRDSFVATLEMLTMQERMSRAMDQRQPSRFGALPFAVSLDGWPKRRRRRGL